VPRNRQVTAPPSIETGARFAIGIVPRDVEAKPTDPLRRDRRRRRTVALARREEGELAFMGTLKPVTR
jgi:hypothetical protein